MGSIRIEKTTDKKFLVNATYSSEFKKQKRGTFVFETLDEVIDFIKEAYQKE